MRRHLLVDFLRRHWAVYAIAMAGLAALWWSGGFSVFGPHFLVAMSLAAVFVLGPVLALGQLNATEILLLPVARQELWRTSWILCIVVATQTTTIAKVIGTAAARGSAGPDAPDFSMVAISSLLDFAYAGLMLALLPAIRAIWKDGGRRVERALSTAALVVVMSIVAGGIFWGFLFQLYLPTQWSDMRGPAGSLLLAGIGVTLAAYFYVPPPGARVVNRGTDRPAARRGTSARLTQEGGLTGLRLLFVQETLVTIAAFVGSIVLMLGVWSLFEPKEKGIAVDLQAFNLLPFASDAPAVRLFPLLIVGWVTLTSAAPTRDALGTSWRHFRTLPLSTRGLAALLLARRALGWIAMWAVLFVMHLVVIRDWPQTGRLELLLMCVGLDALIYAVQVKWIRMSAGLPGMMLFGALMLVFGLVVVLPLRLVGVTWSDPLLVPVGIAAFCVGAWMLHRTLTRSSAIYAPVKSVPLGAIG